jgi:guanyl-specific ribonuclease Sa
MNTNRTVRGVLALVGLIVVAVVALVVVHAERHTPAPAKATGTVSRPIYASAAPIDAHAPGVPDRAYQTLSEIDAGRWPGEATPGTHGGETWTDREGSLPRTNASGQPITYQEWDVNPKQPGRSRDAERIVTGSDGSAYYTGDHYQTFIRMR